MRWRASWASVATRFTDVIRAGDVDRDLDDEPVRYGPRAPVPTKLDAYKPIIEARLAAYPELSAVRLLDEIRGAGYAGSYTQLKEFVRRVVHDVDDRDRSQRVRGFLVPSITTPSASGIVNAMRSSGPKFLVMCPLPDVSSIRLICPGPATTWTPPDTSTSELPESVITN